MRARWWSVMMAVVAIAVSPGARATEPAAPAEPYFHPSALADQWKPIKRSRALDVPSPVTRDEDVQRVTLKEAIAIALENNPGIAAKRLEPARVETNVLQAQAQYDPLLSGELNYTRSVTPNSSSLSGISTSVVNDRYANAHLSKLFRSSTQVNIDFLNDRLDNNARFFGLRPQYQPQLNLSIVQPLLRDFGWNFSYLVVRVAERNADASVYLYEADLANFVTTVIAAYWRVVAAREAVEVRQEAKRLADRTVEENEARVRVGLLAPVSVLEAQADAASREEQLIEANNELALARQSLAQIAFYRPNATFVPRTLEPVEDVTLEEVDANVDKTLDTALADRPEIIASAQGVEAKQIQERIATNGLLPRLDVVGSYGVNGLSGRSVQSSTTFISTTNVSATNPNVHCTLITVGIYSCTLPLPGSGLNGTRGDAYSTRSNGGLLSGDFDTYSFGLRLTVPIDNAQARSQHTRTRIELDQAEFNHRDLLSQVTLEVRQTIADLVSARQRIDTSKVARELAEENLRNQEKRHEVGMATTKDLLDFQTRLTEARFAEVQSKLDYNVAVARWRRAKGHILDTYQIVLEHPGRRTTPWFALF